MATVAKASFSSLSRFGAAAPNFNPNLLSSSNIPRPPHPFPASSIFPKSQQERLRSRASFNPICQISQAKSRFICFRCGMLGHFVRNCSLPPRCFNCRATGHKRVSCPDLNSKMHSHSALFNRDDSVEDSWMTNLCRDKPPDRVDVFLLDPDVVAGCGKRLLQTDSGSPSDLQAESGDPGPERREDSLQGCLYPRGLICNADKFTLARMCGPFRGIGSPWIASRRPKRVMGKGKSRCAQYGMKKSVNLWGLRGKRCKELAGYPISAFPQVISSRRLPIPPPLEEVCTDFEDPVLDAAKSNELPPFPHCRGSSGLSPLKPEPEKRRSSRAKLHPMPDSPIKLRRSPRLNHA